jgi:hypothetical protein
VFPVEVDLACHDVAHRGFARDAETVPGKSSPRCTSHSSSCRSGEKSWAGSPAAIQPIGTTLSGRSRELTCSTLLIRSSERVPATAPGKTETPVATNTVQDAGPFAEYDRAAQHGRGCDVRRLRQDRALAAMLDQLDGQE